MVLSAGYAPTWEFESDEIAAILACLKAILYYRESFDRATKPRFFLPSHPNGLIFKTLLIFLTPPLASAACSQNLNICF
jgi:hypothetical protein